MTISLDAASRQTFSPASRSSASSNSDSALRSYVWYKCSTRSSLLMFNYKLFSTKQTTANSLVPCGRAPPFIHYSPLSCLHALRLHLHSLLFSFSFLSTRTHSLSDVYSLSLSPPPRSLWSLALSGAGLLECAGRVTAVHSQPNKE